MSDTPDNEQALKDLYEEVASSPEEVKAKARKILDQKKKIAREKELANVDLTQFPIPRVEVDHYSVWHPEEAFSGWNNRIVFKPQPDYLSFLTDLEALEDYLTERGYAFKTVDQEVIYFRDIGLALDLYMKDPVSFALLFEKVEVKCS